MLTTGDLIDRAYCLTNVSKNFEGDLRPVDVEPRRCESGCETLVVEQHLVAEIAGHDCDGNIGRLLDGRLVVELIHVFTDGKPDQRAVHAGKFRWLAAAGQIAGELNGLTNAGTHRPPAFGECQTCDERGVMEGRLWGRFRRVNEPIFANALMEASYRIRFDPTGEGGQGRVVGTIEGSLVTPCAEPRCLDFTNYAPGAQLPNPVTSSGFTVTTRDFTGAATSPTNAVRHYGPATAPGLTGLSLGWSADITLPFPAMRAELTVYAGAQAGRFDAVDAVGTVVGSASTATSNQAETVTLSPGTPFVRIEVSAPSDELLLGELCIWPEAEPKA
jgi:hypothetical protein